jgi:hypothetical protein
MTPEEAMEYGIIDEVRVRARASLSPYASVLRCILYAVDYTHIHAVESTASLL